MFALRCLGVSLAFFLAFYCLSSLAVLRGWRLALRGFGHLSSRAVADGLLALRTLPLAAAAVATLAFVVPSFLLLEPRVSSEPVGEVPLFLGVCCLALFAAGAWNAAAAHARTSRTVAGWLAEATALVNEPVPVFRIRPAVPALTVAGVCSPRVLVSHAASAALSVPEFEIAMKHELAHVHRRDNLKKLLFHVCGFPGMWALEAAWGDAAEMAADDAAVRCAGDALDLASALIKLSRFASVQAGADLTSALVQNAGAVNQRVARLLTWKEPRRGSGWLMTWCLALPVAGGVALLVLTYGSALSGTHALTEWLVR
jgi:Zn-dependent protease with chaperone function